MKQTMLSTSDNPYDPFTQYSQWYAFDQSKGYHSLSYLARVVVTSDELSEFDQQLAIEEAVDEIVEANIIGLYIKVTRDIEEETKI